MDGMREQGFCLTGRDESMTGGELQMQITVIDGLLSVCQVADGTALTAQGDYWFLEKRRKNGHWCAVQQMCLRMHCDAKMDGGR